MLIRLLCVCGALSFFAQLSNGQRCSEMHIPVVVVKRSSVLITDLKALDFVVQANRKQLQVEGAIYDVGPRRILIVLDTGQGMKEAGWRIASSVVTEILERGRAEDSFAILTARGPRIESKFGEPREALRSKLKALVDSGKRKGSSAGALDAVLEGAEWFDGTRPGDAILLVADDVQKNSAAGYDRVAKYLAARRIRLFTFLVGQFVAGTYHSFISAGPPSQGVNVSSTLDPNNIARATEYTGGYIVVENTDHPLKEYKLAPERLAALKIIAWQMYGAIAQTYYLRITGMEKRSPLRVALSDSAKGQRPDAVLFHPRNPACSIHEQAKD